MLSPHILIIDSDAQFRENVTQFLAEHYDTDIVSDASSAFKIAREKIPDLLLANVMAAKLDDVDLGRKFRKAVKLLFIRAGCPRFVRVAVPTDALPRKVRSRYRSSGHLDSCSNSEPPNTPGRENFEKSSNNGYKRSGLFGPERPAEITTDGENLKIHPAKSIHSSALAQEPP